MAAHFRLLTSATETNLTNFASKYFQNSLAVNLAFSGTTTI